MVNVQVGACGGGKTCTELGARLVSRSSVDCCQLFVRFAIILFSTLVLLLWESNQQKYLNGLALFLCHILHNRLLDGMVGGGVGSGGRTRRMQYIPDST